MRPWRRSRPRPRGGPRSSRRHSQDFKVFLNFLLAFRPRTDQWLENPLLTGEQFRRRKCPVRKPIRHDMEQEREMRVRGAWSAVVAFEDTATREEAAKFCDVLVERFRSRHEFQITWCSFSAIQTAASSSEA